MGESEGWKREGKCRRDAEEANDFCQRSQKDCCRTTRALGEGEGRKENGVTQNVKSRTSRGLAVFSFRS
jgi:hypothetical protein